MSQPKASEIVTVELGERSYPIHIGPGLLDRAGALIQPVMRGNRALVITDDQVAAIRALHTGMEACAVPADLQRYRDLNRRFHEAVFQASHRSYLIRNLLQLWSAFPTMLWSNVPRVAVTSVPDRNDPDNQEHAEVVAALGARDPERAEHAVRRHVEAAAAALMAAMRGEP